MKNKNIFLFTLCVVIFAKIISTQYKGFWVDALFFIAGTAFFLAIAKALYDFSLKIVHFLAKMDEIIYFIEKIEKLVQNAKRKWKL